MKIIHRLRNYFPDHVGGTKIYVVALCKELKAMGMQAAVVKPSFTNVFNKRLA